MRIGIDLGGTKIEGVALDKNGSELTRKRVPTPRGDYTATVTAVRDIVFALEKETSQQGSVGIGMPGTLSQVTGRVKNSNSTCLNHMPFNEDISAALERPVRLANDADCFALSEATDGAGAGMPSVFGVILGTGVGGGIVINGSLLSGPNGIAGEWGHNPLPRILPDEFPGPRCYCGKEGCIESWCSGPAFETEYETAENEKLTAAEIADLARKGHRPAKSAIRRYSDRVARALSHVINLLDPHVIVLGGGMSNIDEIYDEITARWDNYIFSDSVETKLLRNKHGDSGGVRGAAWLWPDR
tara:strand:- start:62698 stop:63597 length:900 start_codon:yes stop_codon:yes gene_type:complete